MTMPEATINVKIVKSTGQGQESIIGPVGKTVARTALTVALAEGAGAMGAAGLMHGLQMDFGAKLLLTEGRLKKVEDRLKRIEIGKSTSSGERMRPRGPGGTYAPKGHAAWDTFVNQNMANPKYYGGDPALGIQASSRSTMPYFGYRGRSIFPQTGNSYDDILSGEYGGSTYSSKGLPAPSDYSDVNWERVGKLKYARRAGPAIARRQQFHIPNAAQAIAYRGGFGGLGALVNRLPILGRAKAWMQGMVSDVSQRETAMMALEKTEFVAAQKFARLKDTWFAPLARRPLAITRAKLGGAIGSYETSKIIGPVMEAQRAASAGFQEAFGMSMGRAAGMIGMAGKGIFAALAGGEILSRMGRQASLQAQDRIKFQAGVAFPDFVRQAQSAQNPIYSSAIQSQAEFHDHKSRQVAALLAGSAGIGERAWNWLSQQKNALLGQYKPMSLIDKRQKEIIATMEDTFNINMQLSGSLAEAMGMPMTSALTPAAKRNAVSTALSEASYLDDPIGKFAQAMSQAAAAWTPGMGDSGKLGIEYQYAAARQLFPEWVAGIEEKARIDLNNKERKAALQRWKDNEHRASSALADPARSFKRQMDMRKNNFLYDLIWPKVQPLISEYSQIWGAAHG